MAATVMKVRDRCRAEDLNFSSETYGKRFAGCEAYVKLENGRAKLLIVREDDMGNGELVWWQWIPILKEVSDE